MFTTLPESRAIRTRSARGTLVSVMLHGALIAGAVAMTLPRRMDARPEPARDKQIVFVVAAQPPRQHSIPMPPRRQLMQPSASLSTIAVPAITPAPLPPIDQIGPPLPAEQIAIGGPSALTAPSIGDGGPGMPTPGGVVDVSVVERMPRILGGAPVPRYPVSGVSGRVVVRFVVDTVGRAELDGVVVIEATHALFADAVKSALGLYRFSPGEFGGRKVRTMVQQQFTFMLRP